MPEPVVVGQFNHPGMRKPVIGGNDWNGFDYRSDADLRVKLMDVATTRDAAEDNRESMGFIPALDQGWHLGPKGEEDNHHALEQMRMVLKADVRPSAELDLDALKAVPAGDGGPN